MVLKYSHFTLQIAHSSLIWASWTSSWPTLPQINTFEPKVGPNERLGGPFEPLFLVSPLEQVEPRVCLVEPTFGLFEPWVCLMELWVSSRPFYTSTRLAELRLPYFRHRHCLKPQFWQDFGRLEVMRVCKNHPYSFNFCSYVNNLYTNWARCSLMHGMPLV